MSSIFGNGATAIVIKLRRYIHVHVEVRRQVMKRVEADIETDKAIQQNWIKETRTQLYLKSDRSVRTITNQIICFRSSVRCNLSQTFFSSADLPEIWTQQFIVRSQLIESLESRSYVCRVEDVPGYRPIQPALQQITFLELTPLSYRYFIWSSHGNSFLWIAWNI